jgi:hypothetical protein
MGEAVPTAAEIMEKAHEILAYAVEKEGRDEQHLEEGVDPNENGAYNMLRARYSWIVDRFASALALAPDPAQLDPYIDAMREADTTLTGGAELHLASVDVNGNVTSAVSAQPVDPFANDVNNISAKIAAWTGDAADDFRGNFLSHLSVAPTNHSSVFRTQNVTLVTIQKVYQQYLRDLDELATKAKTALHPGNGFCHRPNLDVLVGLAVGVSKIAVGVATIEEGAGVFEIVAGGLEVVHTVMEAGKEEGGESYSVDGVDVDSILDATTYVMDKITGHLDQCEKDILTIIQFNQSALDGKFATYFVTPQPTVVAASKKPVTQLWNDFD